MRMFIGTLLICATIINYGQTYKGRTITTLEKSLAESSGLLFVEGRLITFNDSGGEPELYEIDTLDGSIKRTVSIKNATNKDWEAITNDDQHIYIGDIGNNSGTRKDLTIYKIRTKDFLSEKSVKSEVITYSYKSQTSFKSEPHHTLYDAEAMVFMNDSLVLFNKNWRSDTCLVYKLPIFPGDYELTSHESLVLPGKVTDAFFVPNKNQLFMVGYGEDPFIGSIITTHQSLDHNVISIANLSVESSFQIEGLCSDGKTVFCSSERMKLGSVDFKGELTELPFAYSLSRVQGQSKNLSVRVQGNAYIFQSAKKKIKLIELFDPNHMSVLTSKGCSKNYVLEASKLTKGSYAVQIRLSNGDLERLKILVD